MKKGSLVCLGCIGDDTTQLYGDGKPTGIMEGNQFFFFFVAHLGLGDFLFSSGFRPFWPEKKCKSLAGVIGIMFLHFRRRCVGVLRVFLSAIVYHHLQRYSCTLSTTREHANRSGSREFVGYSCSLLKSLFLGVCRILGNN